MYVYAFLRGGVTASSQANWLSKQLDKLTKISSPTIQESSDAAPTNSSRWIKVYEGKYFTTYIDRRSMKAEGQAQSREVSGWFKRVYTPTASYYLGVNSGGQVKPDTITHSIYKGCYRVNEYNAATFTYYDVHNNLIYEGTLSSDHYYGSW